MGTLLRIDIPFVVEKQHITQPTQEILVGGGKNYFYATFTINDVWDDISNIKVVFVRDGISKLIDELIKTESGFECQIPWEVMADKGAFQVGIFGGDRLLTDYTYVIVKEGCVIDGETPKPPTPDWFNNVDGKILKLESSKVDRVEIDKKLEDYYNKTEVEGYVDEKTRIIESDVEGLRSQINEEAHFRGYLSTNAKIQSLEATPNDFAYSAESGTKWVYDVDNGWVDTGTPVPDQLTPASDTTPLINGTPSAGQENAYARGDHRHPTDTTRASVEQLNKAKSDLESAIDACGDFELVTSATLTEKVAVIQHTFDKEYKELHIRFKIPMSDEAAADAASTNKARWMVFTANENGALNQPIYNMGNQFISDYKYAWRAAFHIKMNGNYCRTDLWFGNAQIMDTAYAMTDNSNTYNGFVAPSVPISRDYIQKLKISFMYEAGKTDASIRYLPVGTKYEIWGLRK